jgi:CRP-like cAMP-binding protein
VPSAKLGLGDPDSAQPLFERALQSLDRGLEREPLLALARQYPDIFLELINILSQRLRLTTNQIAQHTRSQPRELHQLFDELDK